MWNTPVVLILITVQLLQIHSQTTEPWPLKWFPRNPEEISSSTSSPAAPIYTEGGAAPVRTMGQVNSQCDDAKTNLTLDDDGKSQICHLGTTLKPTRFLEPEFNVYEIPERYVALHRCMNEAIEYDYRVPTFGTHRGLWPRYGEYSYVPVQRWLHNLEHGGIVMLYHPCADPAEVEELRGIVTSCLFRHVITPSERLTTERPFALVAWGAIVEMANVNKETAVGFIMSHALRGPEKTSRDGQFDKNLIKPAEIVSDHDDYELCPKRFDKQ